MSDAPVSAQAALARLLLAGAGEAELRRCVSDRAELADVLVRLPGLRAAFAALDHAAPADMAAVGTMFDRAVAASPEASVAAVSLGDPALLAAGTAEILGWLDHAGLVQADAVVIDLGCGIGRVAAALASRVRCVLGLDVSAGMLAEARRRCGSANVQFVQTDGRQIPVRDGRADLALAVDCFPYAVQAGVADGLAAEAVRTLRPGGALAVLNLSYRGAAFDGDMAARWEAAFGLMPRVTGARPFSLWDGSAWLWRLDPALDGGRVLR